MKGIVLAGGTGSRLWPLTKVVSKQLLPVYDKPLIYYPISTLMLAGIREILIITTPHDSESFKNLLGDGSNFGIDINYAVQPKPEGLAQAFIIGEDFIGKDNCMLILGDNIFHGAGLGTQLSKTLPNSGAHIFTYEVSNPEDYGILYLDSQGTPHKVLEKPLDRDSNLAITGLYFFDNKVIEIAKEVTPSVRGELEITSVISNYLNEGKLTFTKLTRGVAWLDTGTIDAINLASNYVRIVEERTGLNIACLEEIGLGNGWISKQVLENKIKNYGSNTYLKYLKRAIENAENANF